jgi:hypothetical protein
MKLDVYDGQIRFLERRYDLQLAAVNRLLARQALDSIDLIDSGSPFACENLKSISSARPLVRGPRVSILMPAYNSEGTIGYALESLRNRLTKILKSSSSMMRAQTERHASQLNS